MRKLNDVKIHERKSSRRDSEVTENDLNLPTVKNFFPSVEKDLSKEIPKPPRLEKMKTSSSAKKDSKDNKKSILRIMISGFKISQKEID